MSDSGHQHHIEVKGVSKYFGGIHALENVNFTVPKGQITGLIGPNGAGKTTLFNIIAGTYRPTSGKILMNGINITNYSPSKTTEFGIARTFQLVKVFPTLTVLENVLTGALNGTNRIVSYAEGIEMSTRALKFIGMEKHSHKLVSSLVLTDRKKIELARALATEPEIILLDEIIAGLNPQETKEFLEIIKKANNELNITLIMVEHIMKAVMGISNKIVVLNYGEKIAEGTPSEIANNESVIEAYLGDEASEVLKFA